MRKFFLFFLILASLSLSAEAQHLIGYKFLTFSSQHGLLEKDGNVYYFTPSKTPILLGEATLFSIKGDEVVLYKDGQLSYFKSGKLIGRVDFHGEGVPYAIAVSNGKVYVLSSTGREKRYLSEYSITSDGLFFVNSTQTDIESFVTGDKGGLFVFSNSSVFWYVDGKLSKPLMGYPIKGFQYPPLEEDSFSAIPGREVVVIFQKLSSQEGKARILTFLGDAFTPAFDGNYLYVPTTYGEVRVYKYPSLELSGVYPVKGNLFKKPFRWGNLVIIPYSQGYAVFRDGKPIVEETYEDEFVYGAMPSNDGFYLFTNKKAYTKTSLRGCYIKSPLTVALKYALEIPIQGTGGEPYISYDGAKWEGGKSSIYLDLGTVEEGEAVKVYCKVPGEEEPYTYVYAYKPLGIVGPAIEIVGKEKVKKGESVIITFKDPRSNVSLRGVNVSIDGEWRYVKGPYLRLTFSSPGKHSIIAEKRGYERGELNVEVEGDITDFLMPVFAVLLIGGVAAGVYYYLSQREV